MQNITLEWVTAVAAIIGGVAALFSAWIGQRQFRLTKTSLQKPPPVIYCDIAPSTDRMGWHRVTITLPVASMPYVFLGVRVISPRSARIAIPDLIMITDRYGGFTMEDQAENTAGEKQVSTPERWIKVRPPQERWIHAHLPPSEEEALVLRVFWS